MAPFASMTVRSFRRAILFLVVLFTAISVWGLDRPAFARSLEAESDWYRAIGVWKEIRFEARDQDTILRATQAILVDLYRAQQFELGLTELSRIEDKSPEEWAWNGLYQYKLKQFPGAEYSWLQAQEPLYLGLLYAKTGRTDQAKKAWQGLDLPNPAEPNGENRNPLLAATMSSLVPGSGQIYTGHWFDGAQAFALDSFFGFAAYASYLYDSKVSGSYALTAISLGVFAVFHAANIYGAYKTGEYFNQNEDNLRMSRLESAVFTRRLPNLVPTD